MTSNQTCVICAWRGHCAKRFSVADGGARCPDFCRDVSVRQDVPTDVDTGADKEHKK